MEFHPVGSFPEEAAVWLAQALVAKGPFDSASPLWQRGECGEMTHRAALRTSARPDSSLAVGLIAALKSLFKARLRSIATGPPIWVASPASSRAGGEDCTPPIVTAARRSRPCVDWKNDPSTGDLTATLSERTSCSERFPHP